MSTQGFTSNHRITAVVVVICLCFAGVVVRLVDLHVVERDRLLRVISKARFDIIQENARRGDIKDINGKTLATSKTQIILGVDPHALRLEDQKKWAKLAELIQVPLKDLETIFNTKSRKASAAPKNITPSKLAGATNLSKVVSQATASVPGSGAVASLDSGPDASSASENASDEVAATEVPAAPKFSFGSEAPAEDSNEVLDEEPNEKGERDIRWAKLCEGLDESVYEQVTKLDIKGVYGNRVYRRVYPYKGLASHIVGYVNKENVPSAGLERYADFYLQGQKGWVVSERDGRRRELAQFRTREVKPVDGYDVVLSIDSVVQNIVEEELKYIAEKYKPVKATIIVSDAQSGFLLALGNYPSYNPNEYSKAEMSALKNVAVTDVYEPGSTFKIVAASSALDLGLVSPDRKFNCSEDTVTYKGKVIGLREDHKFEHPISVREILSHSSNRGAAQMAFLVGEEKYYNYAKAFNVGKSTGFPSDSESRGIIHPWEKWSPKDFSRIAMGHSVGVTALQAHSAMGVIASGGKWLRPQVIREIRDSSGEVVFRYEGVAERRVIQQATAEKMASMLSWVTIKNEGTAPTAAIDGFDVAGKTGTTQKVKDGTYSSRCHVASFVGFFPASRPAVVISIIVDEASINLGPRGVAYGSAVAAPSFKHIGEQLVQYLNIKPVLDVKRAGAVAMGAGK